MQPRASVVTNFCALCREERTWVTERHGAGSVSYWQHVKTKSRYCGSDDLKNADGKKQIAWEKRRVTLEALGILHVQMRKAVNAIQEGKPFDPRIYTALEYADEQLSTYGFEFHSE